MNGKSTGRRSFLKQIAVLSTTGIPGCTILAPGAAHSAETGRPGKIAYDPAAKFEIEVSEVEFRRTAAGRQLMARIYQPKGKGPFPTLLDLHGGAWNRKDRKAEEPMDRSIARQLRA